MPRDIEPSSMARRGALDAQIVHRIIDESGLQVRRLPHEPAGGHDLVDDEPGLIAANSRPFSLVILSTIAAKMSSGSVMPCRRHSCSKMRRIALQAGRANFDLVRQAPQERGIHQVFRFQVGGKHHHRFERNAEAFSGVQL